MRSRSGRRGKDNAEPPCESGGRTAGGGAAQAAWHSYGNCSGHVSAADQPHRRNPLPISLPKAPASINADAMTAGKLHAALQAGYDDMLSGKVQDASAVFAAFRESRE